MHLGIIVCTILATIIGGNCQLLAIEPGFNKTNSLLQNVTITTSTMSSILQVLENSVLPEIILHLQNQWSKENDYRNNTIGILQNQLEAQQDNHNEIKISLQEQSHIMTQIAETQSLMANTFNHVVTILDNISSTIEQELEQQAVEIELLNQQVKSMRNCCLKGGDRVRVTPAEVTTDQSTTTEDVTTADDEAPMTAKNSQDEETTTNPPTTELTSTVTTSYQATGNALVSAECLQCICTVLSGCAMPDPYRINHPDMGNIYFNNAKADPSWPAGLTLGYEDCQLDFQCSEQVVISYMESNKVNIQSYIEATPTCEQLSKIHKALNFLLWKFGVDPDTLEAFWWDVLTECPSLNI